MQLKLILLIVTMLPALAVGDDDIRVEKKISSAGRRITYKTYRGDMLICERKEHDADGDGKYETVGESFYFGKGSSVFSFIQFPGAKPSRIFSSNDCLAMSGSLKKDDPTEYLILIHRKGLLEAFKFDSGKHNPLSGKELEAMKKKFEAFDLQLKTAFSDTDKKESNKDGDQESVP